MQNGWILDVIDDLRRFADKNGYAAISVKLEEAAHTALRELSVPRASPENGGLGHAGEPRSLHRQAQQGHDT